MALDNCSVGMKLLTAGSAACFADLLTFPLDTAKVRMQIAGECRPILVASAEGSVLAMRSSVPGLFETIANIVRIEGARSLYGGLSAGLQRQMCFGSVRLGLYDSVKSLYAGLIDGKNRPGPWTNFGICVSAGITTGAMAVLVAQPTDVVKVRLQAGTLGTSTVRYHSTLHAYKSIALNEGPRGLWKGVYPNMSRNAIVNVAEIVSYDIVKQKILQSGVKDGIPCQLMAAISAGIITTLFASPFDVVKTRYMNSAPGEYLGPMDAAIRMWTNEGSMAFYKGSVPSFARLVSWNIVLWLTYEQIKLLMRSNPREH